MRIRKHRSMRGGTGGRQQQLDVSGGVINNGGFYALVNPPNSSSSRDLKIPPSCLFSQAGLRHASLLGSSASGPQRQPAAVAAPSKEYICDVATSGRSSRHEVLMATGERVDVSEVLHTHANCVDKSSSEELASVIRGDEVGCKKAKDDSMGSAGCCRKDADIGRPSDPVVDCHSLISFSRQKVLPWELILSNGSRPARVSKSPTNNTEVRNNVPQVTRSSNMSKLKSEEAATRAEAEEEAEVEEEKGHNRRRKSLEAQAATLPDASRDPEFVNLERRKAKKDRNAIRRDLPWLVSSLKGHRRVRSVGQRQRSRVVAARVGGGNAWAGAALGQLMPVVGAGYPALEATNEAANLSLEQKDIVPNEGPHACMRAQEKKQKKTIMMKKVAKIDINRMDTHASTPTNGGEKLKGSTKNKKKMDQQPAQDVVVELKNKALKKRTREPKEEVVAVLERCKRKDGRDWQCREPVVKIGATYCEYHTLKMKENHARNAEKLANLQVGLSKSRKRRDSMQDGAECGGEEDHDAEKSGGQVVVQLLRRRWRKKCKPCIRRLHEIQERALPADTELTEWEGEEGKEETSVSATPWAPSPETHEPPHIQLPECLLNTDPREWRSDFL